MLFIIGLGNPGDDYVNTRHNIGFEIVDAVARKLKATFREGKGDYLVALASLRTIDVGLAKPLTYMNNSGDAVADISEQFAVPSDKLLVVCDDFQLPLGTLRLRVQGSDGGHNGLASIVDRLQTDQFPRLRCGIGSEFMPTEKAMMREFVLEEFRREEHDKAREMTEKARDACLCFVEYGPEKTMNIYNRSDN